MNRRIVRWRMAGGALVALIVLAAIGVAEETRRTRDPRLDSNLAVVFDGSGSMTGKPIETAKTSLVSFLRSVPEGWNVGVVVFDKSGTRELLPMGRYTPEQFASAVAPIKAGGGTPLGLAISEARAMLAKQRETQQGYGSYRVLVVTDGAASDQSDMERAAARILSDGTEMSVIGFRIKGGHKLREYATDYREAGDAKALSRAMAEAVAETDTSDESFVFEPLFPAREAR